ncbi:MAG: M48 family metalloprotease [Ignavibacteria bacterium]
MDNQTSRDGINVFEFPVETDTRFLLLILAAFFFAINTGQNLGRSVSVLTENNYNAGNDVDGDPTYEKKDPSMFENFDEYYKNSRTIFIDSLRALIFPLIFVVLLFFCAYVLYRKYPSQIIKKKHLHELNPESDRHFTMYIKEITGDLHIKNIDLMTTRSVSSFNAQAFGFSSRFFLRLDGGLRITYRKSKEVFRAIVLHEFGHILNKDIFKTYFSQSLWYSVILIFVLPVFLSITLIFASGVIDKLTSGGPLVGNIFSIFFSNIPNTLKLIVQYFILFVFLAYIRSSILKTREYYADQRAVTLGAKEGLLKILHSHSGSDNVSLWKKIRMLHPTSRQRVSAINNPESIFDIKYELAFVAGFLTSLIINGMMMPLIQLSLLLSSITGLGSIFQSLFADKILLVIGFLLPALIISSTGFLIAYLISASISVELLKNSYVNLYLKRIQNYKYLKFLIIAFLFAFGNEIGFLIQPISTIIPRSFYSVLLIILLQGFFMFILFLSFCLTDSVGLKMLAIRQNNVSIKSKFRTITLLNTLVIFLFVILIFGLRIYIIFGF